MPGPILDNVDFPYAFPLPPDLGEEVFSPGRADAERGWYYYLSEIAARHLLNRISRTHAQKSWANSEGEIRRMVAQAEELEEQVQQWYASLPSLFHFDIPSAYSLTPHPDELAYILQNRYINAQELIGRPFVRICIEKRLQIEPRLREQVAAFASRGLQCCMLKIHPYRPQIHHGTWFALRNTVCMGLILASANEAQQRPWLLGAQEMVVPPRWREALIEAKQALEPYWDYPGDGLKELASILDAILGRFPDND